MNMTPVYLFTIPGNTSIKISPDELRSLLTEIEAKLHNSQVYLRAMVTLQNLQGASGEPAKILLKAVGREAISLAFQELVQQKEITETNPVSPNIEPETVSNVSEIKVEPQTSNGHINQDNETAEPTVHSETSRKINSPSAALNKWLKPNKKHSEAELAKQRAAEERREIMYKIGQELKQARESQGLSLCQLNIYTHVPIYQMEAIENSRFETLPEDTLVRRFIRVMGNSLGLNGANLAASLPAPEAVQSILPSWQNSPKFSGGLGVDIRPIHLYLGYTALMAGAMGGLSLTSGQTNNGRVLKTDMVISPSSYVSESPQMSEVGLKSGRKCSGFGSHIAPPESF
ncbi:MAG TPA: helix-turn-helix domain-containing protein [Nodularia sp. (in: cyanobacteria)]|nr:helix-turn-helix domain-containing protein [Nodularia sp. (in: cyanobacteria)]